MMEKMLWKVDLSVQNQETELEKTGNKENRKKVNKARL